jgi:hypothetical protein
MFPCPPPQPLQVSSYAAPLTQAYSLEAETMSLDAEWPTLKVVDYRSFARGVRWALTIESAAALCLYAIWHLWQLWR